jgi:hypothetical protein
MSDQFLRMNKEQARAWGINMTTKKQHTYPPLKEWPEWARCATTDNNGRRDYWSNLDCYWYRTGYKKVFGAWWFGSLVGKTERLDPNTFDGIKNDGINSKVTREEQQAREINDVTGEIALNIAKDGWSFDRFPASKQRAIECGYIDADNVSGVIKSNLVAVPKANRTQRTHYHVEIIPGVWVDVYDVIDAWGLANPAYQHLIKKALKAGNRGHKDLMTDAQDIIDSAIRGKQLIENGGDL